MEIWSSNPKFSDLKNLFSIQTLYVAYSQEDKAYHNSWYVQMVPFISLSGNDNFILLEQRGLAISDYGIEKSKKDYSPVRQCNNPSN